jgi:hypothetical protein
MSAIYLASVLLAAQPEAYYPLLAPPPVIMPSEPLSAAELRKAQEQAIRQSYRADLMEAVPELVKVYRLLEQDKQLNNAERAQLRFKTRSRLLAVGDKIVSDAKRERARQRQEEAAAKRGVRHPLVAPTPATGKPSDYAATAKSVAPQGSAGGLGQDGGEALVELIRNTIKPDSWDVAGGPGRIVYYRQWQALVVHQTEEVHWLIGGMRGALGK